MSETRWMKRAKLVLLAIVGIASVSVPVDRLRSAIGCGSGVVARARCAHRTPDRSENPAKAITASLNARRRGATTRSPSRTGHPGTTERLVRALKQAGAVATFFDVGERAAARPELVELQRTVGQVANHSYTHAHLPTYPSSAASRS